MNCGSWSVVGEAEDGTLIVHPLACRSWSCSRCAYNNKRKLLSRLKAIEVTTLLTLTCNPKRHPHSDDAFQQTSAAVNFLFKRIRRRWPDTKIEYFLVWERTKRGWPHAHLLLRAPFIPQKWLSRVWEELTGAPVVDIRAVHQSHQVVSYIAKYLAKDPQAPPGMKRYRSSRGFFGHVFPNDSSDRPHIRFWKVSRQSADELAHELSTQGFTVAAHADGSYTAFPRGHPHALSLPTLLSDRAILQERLA